MTIVDNLQFKIYNIIYILNSKIIYYRLILSFSKILKISFFNLRNLLCILLCQRIFIKVWESKKSSILNCQLSSIIVYLKLSLIVNLKLSTIVNYHQFLSILNFQLSSILNCQLLSSILNFQLSSILNCQLSSI